MKKVSFFFKDSKPSAQVVGLCFLVIVGFLLATGLQLLFPETDYSNPASIRLALIEQACSTLLIFGLPAIAFTFIYHESRCSFLQMNFGPRRWVLALIALVIWVLIAPLNDWLSTWNQGWVFGKMEVEFRSYAQTAQRILQRLLSQSTPGDLVLQLLAVALVPAICEELFFRGVMQQAFQRCFGNPHPSIILTAILFTLAHGDMYGLMPRLLMGIILGYLFYYSGSILVNTLVHFINNAFIVVMFYLYHQGVVQTHPYAPLEIHWITTLLCTIGAIALFIVYFAKNEQKTNQK